MTILPEEICWILPNLENDIRPFQWYPLAGYLAESLFMNRANLELLRVVVRKRACLTPRWQFFDADQLPSRTLEKRI